MLRIERTRRPVRLVILKARQMGFSTLIEGYNWERAMRRPRSKGLVVAHDDDTSSEVLSMVHTMKDSIPQTAERTWKFAMKHTATYHIKFGPPLESQIKIASARKKNPGRGFTMSFLHASEVAFWEEADRKAQSLLNALAAREGTYCFMESTAEGDIGFFHDTFRQAWEQVHLPFDQRATVWHAMFVPWFEMPEYRWSQTLGAGRPLPDDMALEILDTITPYEEWLLARKYYKRWSPADEWEQVDRKVALGTKKVWRRKNVGDVFVDLDQLAWRRMMLRDQLNGNPFDPATWQRFQAEYPATPDEAFQATGTKVFDLTAIQKALREAMEPVFVGELVDIGPDDEKAEAREEARELNAARALSAMQRGPRRNVDG